MTVKDLIQSLERGRGSMFIFFFFNAKMRIGAWDKEGGKKKHGLTQRKISSVSDIYMHEKRLKHITTR